MKNPEIRVFPDYWSRYELACLLRRVFDRRELWEHRTDRMVPYRNGQWFTLGAPLYLDLQSPEQFEAYTKKVEYWNEVLERGLGAYSLHEVLAKKIARVWENKYRIWMLAHVYGHAALPGFHIFPGFESFGSFFGKPHRDRQWEGLFQFPNFPFKLEDVEEHLSFTLVLKQPYMGSGMLLLDDIARPEYKYEEGSLYVHSGQFLHAIAPYAVPVLPFDWRITLQGHGFRIKEDVYLYW